MHIRMPITAGVVAGLSAFALIGASSAQADPPAKPIPGATVTPPAPGLVTPPAKQKAVKAPKGNPGAPAVNSLTSCAAQPNGACFKYSEQGQALSAADESDGASISFSIHKPFLSLPQQDFHTLAEMSIQGADAGDVIEIGWNVDRTVNGDDNPHLFVFRWVDGVPGTYNSGGGWANASTCAAESVCPGQSLSAAVGTTKAFRWEHIGTAWWALYDNKFVGAYPDSTWAGGFTKARTVRVFGEVAANHSETCTDMGSGAHAGAGASATASAFSLINSTATASLTAGVVTESTYWAQSDTVDNVSFRYGGEGRDSIGGGLGVKDHCAPNASGMPAASSLQLWAEFCPDGQVTTGCNGALGTYTSATTTLNVCKPLTIAQYDLSVLRNNSGVSGRSYQVFSTAACSGSPGATVANGGQLNPAFEPHGIKRIG